MGTYRGSYLGIYLEVPFLKHEETVTFYRNPVTGKPMKKRFNPETGVEGTKESRVEVNYLTPNPYIDDVEGIRADEFSRPAYTGGGKRIETFVLSYTGKYKIGEAGELENIDISDINVPKLIEEFKVDYAWHLEQYTDWYKEVNVKFGLVNYAH